MRFTLPAEPTDHGQRSERCSAFPSKPHNASTAGIRPRPRRTGRHRGEFCAPRSIIVRSDSALMFCAPERHLYGRRHGLGPIGLMGQFGHAARQVCAVSPGWRML